MNLNVQNPKVVQTGRNLRLDSLISKSFTQNNVNNTAQDKSQDQT